MVSQSGIDMTAAEPMQKLINDPANAVADSLRGFALAHASMVRLYESPCVLKMPAPRSSR